MKSLTREEKISYISTIILIGFMCTYIYDYWMGAYLGKSYPFNTFLFKPWDRFNDFFTPMNIVLRGNGNPYNFISPDSINSPLYHLMAIGFMYINPFLSFIVCIFAFIIFFVYVISKNLVLATRMETFKNAIIFSFFTAIFLFSLERSNYEIIIFVLIYFFLEFYRKKNLITCVIILSVAIALKAAPGVLILLFLDAKQYKEALLTLVITLALNLLSYSVFTGGLWHNFQNNLISMKLYSKAYAMSMGGGVGTNSLWGAVKILREYFFNYINIETLYYVHYIIAFTIFVSVSAYILKIEKVFWKKLSLMIIMMSLLPHHSGYPKLMHLYFPMFLFINSGEKDKYDLIYTVLFALILIPKAYYHFPFLPELNESAILLPLFMVLFMGFIIYDGFRTYKIKEKTKTCIA
ncbi:MAG: glycosyltransferase 87 family protein [bacterium]|nr:glycosyltransferase 87 family protein [bacterium]